VAEIRRITRRPQLSAFQNVASEGGSATLLGLAGLMDAAYERLKPAAMEQMAQEGDAAGREMARRGLGDPGGAYSLSTSNAPFRAALRQAESGGRSDVVNSEGFGGFYQWGPERLADYNRATGQNISFDQFLADGDLQETAQDWHEADILKNLGGYVGRTVSGQVMDEAAIIGAAHLGGIGGARRFIETNGAFNPADSNGTRLSDYARRFGGLRVSTKGEAPAVVQKADGSIQPRLYSPASGEILQAHNAAAAVAYQNETMLGASTELLNLSNQFALDPEGFQQAAQGYIDQIVKNAPDMFRRDLRAQLEGQVQRRFLGVLEDKQADIRERASNSNAALIDRHSATLSEAIAAGNPDAIAAAEADLTTQLRIRETLPGLSWTAEQSMNAVLKARERAQSITQDRQTALVKQTEEKLRTMIEAAPKGLTSADEAILNDPNVALLAPDLFQDALAATTFRDALPSFTSAPPAERAATLADLRGQPVRDPRDIKIVEAAEKADQAVTAAFDKDPIAAAGQYLPQKPPALADMTDPKGFGAALSARLAYAKALQAQGYTPDVALLSDAEREQMGAIFSKETPPELKAAAAGAVVQALGDDAALFFRQAKSNDPVTLMVGQMLARGGDQVVALEAMRGQAMLDQGLVILPPKATGVAAVSADIATALSQLPNAVAAEGDIMATAKAIYAARSRGVDPNSPDAARLMGDAVNAALGGSTDRNDRPIGGVQTIGGYPALLPPGMSGETLNAAMQKAFTADMTFGQRMGFPGGSMDIKPDLWKAAGALSVPILEGRPLQQSDLQYVQIVPLGGNMYRLQLNVGGQIVEPHPEGADMLPFLFDVSELIKAAK
jgi:hypothetical protein